MPEHHLQQAVPGRGGDTDPTDPFNRTPAKFGDLINSAFVQDSSRRRTPEGTVFRLGDTRSFLEKLFGRPTSAQATTTVGLFGQPSVITLDSTIVAPANQLQRAVNHEVRHVEDFSDRGVLGLFESAINRLPAMIKDLFVPGGMRPNIYKTPEEVLARRGAEATQIIRKASRSSPLGLQHQIEQNIEFDPELLSREVRSQALDLGPDHQIHSALASQDSLRAKQNKPSQRISRVSVNR